MKKLQEAIESVKAEALPHNLPKIRKMSTNYDMLARVLSAGLKARGYGENTVMSSYADAILAGEAVVEKE